MFKYILKRLLIMIPTLLLIVLVVMGILNFVPGAGIRELSSYSTAGDGLDAFLAALHLHNTFLGRYLRFFSNVLTGNLLGMRSAGMILTVELPLRLRNTLLIALSGILVSFLVGVPLGFLAALHQGKALDHGISTGTILLSSIPSYCIAVICTLIFVVWLRILPLTGYGTPIHFVNPALVTSIPGIAIITAQTRSAVLRVLGEPYITTLHSFGIHSSRIIRVHIFKNSFVIFMSSFQNIAISILCGGMIAENFFSVPGLGRMLVTAVANRSAVGCLTCIVIFASLIMLISFICDLLCLLVDPRMRHSVLEGGRR